MTEKQYDALYRKIQKELNEKMIMASPDEVLEMEPVFRIESEIFPNDKNDLSEMTNPIIKNGRKRVSWKALSSEIAAHEGFYVEINIYDPCIYHLNKQALQEAVWVPETGLSRPSET